MLNSNMASAASGLRECPRLLFHFSNNSLSQFHTMENARGHGWSCLVLKKHGRMGVLTERWRKKRSEAASLCARHPPAPGGDSGGGEYLAKEFGWGVRRMAEVGDEMRKVANVQAEAFHMPVALFNDVFFEFFKAEVLSALIYKIGNSPPDRYACLVAEFTCLPDSQAKTVEKLVGVADCTVQRDADVLSHLQGAKEYLYVSGIAVLTRFRRKKVATVLLKACDTLSRLWGHDYLALRAYEDDSAAQQLYSQAGYKVVSGDPRWTAWVGKKRRLLMIKSFALQ